MNIANSISKPMVCLRQLTRCGYSPRIAKNTANISGVRTNGIQLPAYIIQG